MNNLIDYFDLSSEIRRKRSATKGSKTKSLPWLPQYVALVLGVIVQPWFVSYQQTGHWNLGGFTGRLFFALVVGIVIFPAVYKKAFDIEKPLFVQLCAIFAAGMGWESLLRTALKVTGG